MRQRPLLPLPIVFTAFIVLFLFSFWVLLLDSHYESNTKQNQDVNQCLISDHKYSYKQAPFLSLSSSRAKLANLRVPVGCYHHLHYQAKCLLQPSSATIQTRARSHAIAFIVSVIPNQYSLSRYPLSVLLLLFA